ncbi:MAG: glycosyltransferase [Candidatus Njordarchaeales archaeon]
MKKLIKILAYTKSRYRRIVIISFYPHMLPIAIISKLYIKMIFGKDYRVTLMHDVGDFYPFIIEHLYGRLIALFYGAIEYLLLKRFDYILTPNKVIERIYTKLVDRDNVLTLMNVPCLKQLNKIYTKRNKFRDFFRKSLGISPDSFVIIHSGSMVEDTATLLEALDDISSINRSLINKIYFVKIGWSSSPRISRYAQLVNEKRKKGLRIILIKRVPYLKAMKLMTIADLSVVLLNRRDKNNYFASPNKLFDSLALGIPVLVSNFGFLAYLTRKYNWGYTVNPEDKNAIRDVILYILKNTHELKNKGNRGRQSIEEFFNVEIQARKVKKLLSSLISED